MCKLWFLLILLMCLCNILFAGFNAKKINIVSETQMKNIIDNARGIQHIDYVVKEGDTLASISEHFYGFTCWKVVYDENKDVVGEDPNLIIPGQILKITIKR